MQINDCVTGNLQTVLTAKVINSIAMETKLACPFCRYPKREVCYAYDYPGRHVICAIMPRHICDPAAVPIRPRYRSDVSCASQETLA